MAKKFIRHKIGGIDMSKYHGNEHTKAENDNHSNQLNPNNDAYWSSRGEEDEDYYDDDDE